MAGYSGTPLIKKLGIKANSRIALINAPANFLSELGNLPDDCTVVSRLGKPLQFVLIFVKARRELEKQFEALAAKITPEGMIWVAWPKKSAGVITDLTFDLVQKTGLGCGLVDVKICAIDDTWSGLKFVYRLRDRARRSN